MNPYHDPKTGRFTTPGGAGGRRMSGMERRQLEKEMPGTNQRIDNLRAKMGWPKRAPPQISRPASERTQFSRNMFAETSHRRDYAKQLAASKKREQESQLRSPSRIRYSHSKNVESKATKLQNRMSVVSTQKSAYSNATSAAVKAHWKKTIQSSQRSLLNEKSNLESAIRSQTQMRFNRRIKNTLR